MKSFFKSVLVGVLGAFGLGIISFFLTPLILSKLKFEDASLIYLACIYLPPLIFGGYIGGIFAERKKYLAGLIVGLIVIGIYSIFFIGETYVSSNVFYLVEPVFGGLLGLLGGLLAYNRISTSVLVFAILGIASAVLYINFIPSDVDPKFGEVGYSSSNTEEMSKLKEELKNKSINFRTYMRDEKEFIGYSQKDRERVEEIEHQIRFGVPKGYKKLCISSKTKMNILSEKLINAGIQVLHVDNKDEGEYYCLAWPEKDDGTVAELDENYKSMRNYQLNHHSDNAEN